MSDERIDILDVISQINYRLKKVEEYIHQHSLSDPSLMLCISPLADEDNFRLTFCRKYPNFIPQLRELLPNVTAAEEKLCMMIKLNMTVREIARILNNDVKSVHTARARLKRKLPLEDNTTMDQWIKRIDNQLI